MILEFVVDQQLLLRKQIGKKKGGHDGNLLDEMVSKETTVVVNRDVFLNLQRKILQLLFKD